MSELNGIYTHLNELRKRVLRIAIVVGVIAVFLMTFHLEAVTYSGIMLYYPTPEPLNNIAAQLTDYFRICLLYTSPSPRDRQKSRMPSSA